MDKGEEGENRTLYETLRYCRYMVEHSPLPMVAVQGVNHTVHYVNPTFCLLAGRAKETLIGRPFAEAVSAEEKNECVALLDRVYRMGENQNLDEQQHFNVSSTLIFWSYAAWAILDEEGRPAGVMIQVTDATASVLNRLYRTQANEQMRNINQALIIAGIREQEQAELAAETQLQLLQAQKLESIGRLAGGIAHDFNNLLTAILGYAELAGEAIEADSEVQIYLQNIQKAAERAATLTSQLLAYARKQIIEPKVVTLNTLILDIGKLLHHLLGEHIQLIILPGPDLGLVKIDPGQFGQVLMNLVVNARDAMPKGGKVTIETTNTKRSADTSHSPNEIPAGDYIHLSVSDTGTGMTPETQAHLFEPFFTTKGVGKGTGLGLATCYGIVKQSGGYIEVRNEPGEGAAFHIYLPRIVAETLSTQERTESRLLPSSETILFVEDEELVRYIGVQALRRQGYTVFEAANGMEALNLLHEHSGSIDLLITDVVMPQMGGRALADHLHLTHPDLPVLYISGYTDDAIVQQGMLNPGLAFLQKPFTPAVLALKVREVLDGSGSIKRG